MSGEPLERAQVIRAALMVDGYGSPPRHTAMGQEALAALDALLAEAARLEQEITLREESQIPVIPRGAQALIARLEAALAVAREQEQRLRAALERIAEYEYVGLTPFFVAVARAALVDAPAAATCPECGSEMGEVRAYHTGVCPHHGVQPAAATLAEPEAPRDAE